MGKSYRIRTNVNQDRQIVVNLEQDYEFIEILSLKIKQSDLYLRDCSNYGVIVGRVTANNGYGIPNAKVSVFIPVSDDDAANEVINSIYPYKDVASLNEDGYRYNLLPHEPSYPGHAATGTFPSRFDALTNSTAIEVYEKYYKFTVKTNSSGDYMIFGVPEGNHTIVMDIDLSDIGDFSLTPQDLIRMGRATEEQLNGPFFKSSNNLGELPQLVTLNKETYVRPLWGENEVCQIGISRVDFDLLGEAGIRIEPTSVFMGSIFSTTQKNAIKSNCSVKKTAGELCSLITGPGEIIAIRQTIFQDGDGLPILEEANLPQGGKLIDENGTWIFDLPMNLDYVITNEFGEQVLSDDPKIGIPTKAKYRFKIKWAQSKNINEPVRRAYYLVPNIKEYGWGSQSGQDPANLSISSSNFKKFQSTYAFDLNWSGYTDGFSGLEYDNKINSAISCEDTFYEFYYNKVYTVSSFIDNIKAKQKPSRFLAIKDITSQNCDSENNKFPTNDGVVNKNLIFVLMSIITVILQPVISIILLLFYILAWLWEYILKPIINFVLLLIGGIVWLVCKSINFFRRKSKKIDCVNPKKYKIKGNPFKKLKLPMLSYPDCETCGEKPTENNVTEFEQEPNTTNDVQPTGLMTPFNYADFYSKIIDEPISGLSDDELQELQEVVAGSQKEDKNQLGNFSGNRFSTTDLTLGENINLYNTKDNYFISSNGTNRIQLKIEPTLNLGKNHYDKPLIFVVEEDNLSSFTTGALFSFVDNQFSKDPNFNSAPINQIGTQSITGITSQPTSITINYASPSNRFTNLSTTYVVPQKDINQYYQYPSDIEYYQVITAITVSQIFNLTGTSTGFNTVLFKTMTIQDNSNPLSPITLKPIELFDSYTVKNIVILQRGVDPYSPKFDTEVDLSSIFGHTTPGSVVINSELRVNVPIQSETPGQLSLTDFTTLTSNANINNGQYLFNKSNFFKPGNEYSSFYTDATWFYSRLDNTNLSYQINPADVNTILSGKISVFGAEDLITHPSNQMNGYLGKRLNGGSYTYLGGPSNKYYFSPVYNKSLVNIHMNDDERIILRSDRLPSSSYYTVTNGVRNYYDFKNNKFLLQQQNNFQVFNVESGEQISPSNGLNSISGTSIETDYDIPLTPNVMDTFTCEGMVGLKCYSGNGLTFGVKANCPDKDYVENGKYVFVKKVSFLFPVNFVRWIRDVNNLSEWGNRFRMTWGMCQGVISEVFNNNWVNGTLFHYPFTLNLRYNSQNKVSSSKYCEKTIALHRNTNTFYYRSSPYYNNKFIGRHIDGTGLFNNTINVVSGGNIKNIMHPTTILNLGPKSELLKFITISNKFNGYNVQNIPQSSFGDTSDLINIFFTSRIFSNNFLENFLQTGDGSIDNLFSRNGKKIDGDYAQLSAINSQYGVIKFDSDGYSTSQPAPIPAITLLGNVNSKPTLGVFFSSNTVTLQDMDYVSPGRTNYTQINGNTVYNFYGFKSQEVPFYYWEIKVGASPNNFIFGTQENNWKTDFNTNPVNTGIFSSKYQELDRTAVNGVSPYFIPQIQNNFNNKGYIWTVDSLGVYNVNSNFGGFRNKILLGAPWYFYFGLKNGKTAIDRFNKQYLNIDPNE